MYSGIIISWRDLKAPLLELHLSKHWNVSFEAVRGADRYSIQYRFLLSNSRQYLTANPKVTVSTYNSEDTLDIFPLPEPLITYEEAPVGVAGAFEVDDMHSRPVTHMVMDRPIEQIMEVDFFSKVETLQGVSLVDTDFLFDQYDVPDLLKIVKDKQKDKQKELRDKVLNAPEELKVKARILTI
jgi:hypothetical protein